MTLRRSLLVLILAITGTSALRAQDPRLTNRFSASAAAHFTAIVDSASREGLPTEPLVLRALEGQAKGASIEQIGAAMTRLHDALRNARVVLDPTATAADLVTGAAALQAGVPTARLAELHHLRGTQGIAAPLGAYLDLMARGASADRAWTRIANLARQRATDADFVRLTPQDVDRDASDAKPVHRPETALLRVETGGGQGQIDQMPTTSLTSVGGSFDGRMSHAHLELSGADQDHLTLGVAGAVHGALHATFTPGKWTIAAGPTFDAARDVQLPWATSAGGDVQVSRTIGSFEMGAGVGAGSTSLIGRATTWSQPSLHAGMQAGPIRIDARWQSTDLRDTSVTTFHVTDGVFDSTVQSGLRKINDVSMGLGWGWHIFSLGGHVGRRYGGTVLPQTWWNGTAAMQLTPMVALWAQAGHEPPNVLLALRSMQFATVGLRFDVARRRPVNDRDLIRDFGAVVERESSTTIRIAFALPTGVQRAAVAGDLTQWDPVPLTRDGEGHWTARLNARPGTYRVNVRTDGGAWKVPAGMPTSDDGFGNRVGLLVVE